MANSYDLVTLEQARDQCRIDDVDSDGDGPDDVWLTLCISAASKAVLNYLDGATFLDSDGLVIGSDVPADVKLTTLFLVAEYFKNREAAQDGAVDAQFGYGFLPRPVIALLYPYRTPVIG